MLPVIPLIQEINCHLLGSMLFFFLFFSFLFFCAESVQTFHIRLSKYIIHFIREDINLSLDGCFAL